MSDIGDELKIREKNEEITGLRENVTFPALVNGVRLFDYIADFCYFENNRYVAVDMSEDHSAERDLKIRIIEAIYLGLTVDRHD